MMHPLLLSVAHGLVLIVGVLFATAWLTWLERKILAAAHWRRGPQVVGVFGLLQPVADGIKALTKETIVPHGAQPLLFVLAPALTFVCALLAWAVIPFDEGWVMADVNVGVLYIFAVSSLGVYGIIIAGWASNSRYAFLGAMRSAAQMISYELAIGFILVTVIILAGSLNLSDIVRAQQNLWFAIPLFPVFVMFIICALAETNRAPFDLPEAEAELVAGYNVEYSSLTFALFFLAEYANMLLMAAMTTILFLGGWLPFYDIAPLNLIPGIVWFVLKMTLVIVLFIVARASFPRYRYDQLMRLGWKIFLPLSLFWLVVVSCYVFITSAYGWTS